MKVAPIINYTFELTGNIPSKKNSKRMVTRDRYGRQLNRPLLLSSLNHENWHPFAVLELRRQIKPIEAIAYANVEIIIYNGTKSKGDLTNKAESIMDLLVDMKILEDDNWFVIGDLHLRFGGVDKDFPRAIININTIENINGKIKTKNRTKRT